MAWVRPKHKPKPKDPAESLIPMLSYFSGTPRHNLRPISTSPKALPPAAPVSHDPILRSIQQAQALQHQESATDHQRRQAPDNQPRRQKHLYQPALRDEEEIYEYLSEQHELTPHQKAPSPSRDISPRRSRVPSYERARPPPAMAEGRHKYTSTLRHQPYVPSSSARVSARMTSSRWASATTPLDI
ncbi:MAG: hypothetical protein Q9214_001683 [Letrouitia sp. 1 TL-2023]